jgi:hypothetical protein
MWVKKAPLVWAVSAALSMMAAGVEAVEMGGIELTGSGFTTIVAGKMLGGTKEGKASDLPRPLFVSDYAQGGIYDGRNGLQWKPDTKVGLQGIAKLPGSDFSVTSQIIARGARDGQVNLEWLYGSYKLNENFTLQAGRKRIPMFYYSDTQDVGFALPWTHLPSGPYGWEAVNYNGINLAYQGQWGTWSSAINVMAGKESIKDSGYRKVYNGKNSRMDVKWDDILGGDITLSKDWFETRFVYLQSKMRAKSVSDVWDPVTDTYIPSAAPSDFSDQPVAKQRIYGLAFNVDYNNILVRSEVIYIDHNPVFEVKDHAYLLGVGYRMGKWTPMITLSDYRAQAITSSGAASDGMEATRMTSLTLRYDLTTSSDIKIQLDSQKDRSGPTYTLDGSGVPTNRYGNSRLLTVSYDMVF